MRGDLHDVGLVLGQPGVDALGIGLRTSVTDRGVARGRYRVRRVGNDADLVLAHGGGMRDEHVARLHARQRSRILFGRHGCQSLAIGGCALSHSAPLVRTGRSPAAVQVGTDAEPRAQYRKAWTFMDETSQTFKPWVTF